MESLRKYGRDAEVIKKNGLYVHYSPPKVLGLISSEQLRKWARGGEESRLERAVLAGHGRRLLAETDTLPLSRCLHKLIAKCEALHAAVEKGSLLELQELLTSDYNRNKYVACFDEAGVGLIHKAVYYNYLDIAEWLVNNYPSLVHQRDSEGRTALHYTAACRDEAAAAALLERAGAARGARDAAGRTLAHYRRDRRTLLALPDSATMPARPSAPGLVIKRHNIRIWCHECDMGRLQRVVWEGHGARLLSEVSNQPIVKKFLEAVPYLMNTIRDMHNAVVQNDLEGLMKLTAEPVPAQAFSSRDVNNLTVMHKAAGLGHGSILKYIVERYPEGINDVDNDGRTPLHYAATVKDEQHTYNTLVGFGADESVVDNKNKTPGYYINRSQEIDKSVLKTVPDAPRTPSSAYPNSWDWKILSTDFIADLNKKSRKKNLKASNENISSKKTTSTISESLDNHTSAMKGSSTHELISNLPELDDTEKLQLDDTNEKDVHESEDHQNATEETSHIELDQEKKEEEHNDDEQNNTTEKNTDKGENIKNAEDEEKETVVKTPNVPVSENEPTEKHEAPEKQDVHDDNQKVDVQNNTEGETQENSIHMNNGTENDLETNTANDERNMPEETKTEKESLPAELQEPPNETIANSENHAENKEEQSLEKPSEDEKHASPEETTVQNTEEVNDDKTVDLDGDVNIKDKEEEEKQSTGDEGNYHSDPNEDDDDVQVQGDCNSDHSNNNDDCNLTVAEDSLSKRGHHNQGRQSQESLIEGIISGEAEQDSQDASMTHRGNTVQGDILIVDNEIDPEVTELINTTNMEMLATLVLNGEGSRLLGRHSGNSELQAFLDNVPIYMQKINKVHLAAKEGNIRDLQAVLDRRKFAIARDPISPNGATPLHVATVFGKTNIMKYLGGRFPETLSAVDFEGRTALHYAAVLPDNGHYYNLLQQLGANSKDLDDNGRSAEEYYKNPNLLPFNQLLMDFGISEEEAKNMLSDKGLNHAANGHMDIPIFHTEEGRYLAKSLGDPLIKGLTEVANVKPKDPIAFLASFLHNFPDQEKPRLGTQESNMLITEGQAEVENEEPPPVANNRKQPNGRLTRSAARTATRPHRPIDVITVEPQPDAGTDGPENAFSSNNRDEHGQSMLHFAAARPHTNNALFQLLQESDVSLGYRDELYRTARDVSIQANVPENTVEIDRWVLHLAARGQTDTIMELLLQGYDHILDVVDEDGAPITEVVAQRGDSEMSNLLASIPAFEESRESLHAAIRRGDLVSVQEALAAEGGKTLACGQNSYGRTALHVAVLAEYEDIVAHLAENCSELLRIGDNLERSPLHYAMGVDKIESLSRILIRTGAKRVLKDLKGRQPSYYFMNKSDILRLKEEELIH